MARFLINNSINITIVIAFTKIENTLELALKKGLLISQIPNLGVYTLKTPLIGQISIKTVFSWFQKRPPVPN